MAAHGMSCKRTTTLLSKILPEDHYLLLNMKLIVPKYQLDVETVAYAEKLAVLYNTLGRLVNGSVIYLISKDQRVHKVVLQAVVFAP